MDNPESRPIATPLARRVARDADASEIADATVQAWLEIATSLTPIVGSRGVVALYQRSLHLTTATHPWLAGGPDATDTGMDLAALKAVLAQQSSDSAAAGGNALLQSLHALLASLVGSALTERLLRSVWAPASSREPAQDTKP